MNEMNLTSPCADYEHDLVELLEGSLAPEHARIVHQHVAACARCRAWQREFATLDARLAVALPRPELSADFEQRLRDRLDGSTRNATTPAPDLRSAADREYQRLVDSIRRGARRHALLDAVASATVTGCVLAATHRLLAPLGGFVGTLEGPTRWVMLGAFGSAVAVAALLWSARRGALTPRLLH